MTRRKKIVLRIAFVLTFLLFVVFVTGNVLLTRATRRAFTALSNAAEKQGVEVVYPLFEKARIVGLRSARWYGVRTAVRIAREDSFDPETQFNVVVDRLTLILSGGGQALIVAEGISVEKLRPIEEDKETPAPTDESLTDRIESERVEARIPFDLFQPTKGMREALPMLASLVFSGAAPVHASGDGTLFFSMRGTPHQVRFSFEPQLGECKFTASPEDIRKFSAEFSEQLTDAEVEIISQQPVRAPQLLRIKNTAERESQRAHNKDATIPEDAYRHVLWSYLLTNSYGAEFAELVTDAHEQGDTGNTAAERAMDYNNNAIGRGYAALKIPRDELLDRLLEDPNVIKTP